MGEFAQDYLSAKKNMQLYKGEILIYHDKMVARVKNSAEWIENFPVLCNSLEKWFPCPPFHGSWEFTKLLEQKLSSCRGHSLFSHERPLSGQLLPLTEEFKDDNSQRFVPNKNWNKLLS